LFNRSNNGIDFCKTCESDDNCVPGTSCGYYDNDADHKVCCPGATVDYLLTPYCSGMPNGSTCQRDDMCSSGKPQ
jgi:hypothetical protein